MYRHCQLKRRLLEAIKERVIETCKFTCINSVSVSTLPDASVSKCTEVKVVLWSHSLLCSSLISFIICKIKYSIGWQNTEIACKREESKEREVRTTLGTLKHNFIALYQSKQRYSKFCKMSKLKQVALSSQRM